LHDQRRIIGCIQRSDVLIKEYCWLIVDSWFVLREKHCWLVDDKPSEQDQGSNPIQPWFKKNPRVGGPAGAGEEFPAARVAAVGLP
jgi:hypothetical protein